MNETTMYNKTSIKESIQDNTSQEKSLLDISLDGHLNINNSNETRKDDVFWGEPIGSHTGKAFSFLKLIGMLIIGLMFYSGVRDIFDESIFYIVLNVIFFIVEGFFFFILFSSIGLFTVDKLYEKGFSETIKNTFNKSVYSRNVVKFDEIKSFVFNNKNNNPKHTLSSNFVSYIIDFIDDDDKTTTFTGMYIDGDEKCQLLQKLEQQYTKVALVRYNEELKRNGFVTFYDFDKKPITLNLEAIEYNGQSINYCDIMYCVDDSEMEIRNKNNGSLIMAIDLDVMPNKEAFLSAFSNILKSGHILPQ